MRQAVGNCAANATLVSLVMIGGLSLYWLLLDYTLRPVDAIGRPPYTSAYPLGPPISTFTSGGEMYVNWHMLWTRTGCSAVYTRRFISSHDRVVVPLESHSGVFGRSVPGAVWSVRVPVPRALTPGDWDFRIRGVWECNPLAKHMKDYPPVRISVTKEAVDNRDRSPRLGSPSTLGESE